jgi:hypothetical protein
MVVERDSKAKGSRTNAPVSEGVLGLWKGPNYGGNFTPREPALAQRDLKEIENG